MTLAHATAAGAPKARSQDNVSRLFSGHIGDLQSVTKGAERAARQLEEQFMADGWPTGKHYGNEAELARDCRVGHLVLREAARILEMRHAARVRRGRAGGLELVAPSLESVLEAVQRHFARIAVSTEHIRAAHCVLDLLVARIATRQLPSDATATNVNAVVTFLFQCLELIKNIECTTGVRATGMHPRSRESRYRTLASDLAYRLVESSDDNDWRAGLVLGTEFELCERYRVDRRVLRQAIRILESSDMVLSVPGRAGGLVTRIPGHTSVARVICCYFSANRFDYHETFQAYLWLAVEMTALIASQANADRVEPLRRALAEILRGDTEELSLLQISGIEDAFFELAGNPILNLFLRTTKAFPCWALYRETMPIPTQQHLRELLENIDQILVAVQAGQPAAAAAIQERNLAAVAAWRK